jgi:probable HAF family extracellular repeat protein
MHKRLITLLCAALALGMSACTSEEALTEPSSEASSARAAGKTYIPVDLGTLGGSYSYAFGINPARQVVGGSATADGVAHAFLWSNGVMTDLGTLGGSESAARDNNPARQVVGQSSTADGGVHAYPEGA